MDTHPLRSIVEVLHRADGAYDRQKVRLECGHEVWYSGGAIYRARCRHCAHPTEKGVPVRVWPGARSSDGR